MRPPSPAEVERDRAFQVFAAWCREYTQAASAMYMTDGSYESVVPMDFAVKLGDLALACDEFPPVASRRTTQPKKKGRGKE